MAFAFSLLLFAGRGFAGALAELEWRSWTVDGVAREALVHAPPTNSAPAPVIFAFHGHGGSMRQAARMFDLHARWPEAIVVYPQGFNTPGGLTDPEGKKSGWQRWIGDQADRDLHFFDALLASFRREYAVDSRRLYATGHSNGGNFTYLLWAARGELLAAVAPSAAVMRKDVRRFKPKPVLHVAGEEDDLVPFAWQERMIAELRQKNRCGEGAPWHDEAGCTLYPSAAGAPVVTFIHPGTHAYPAAAPAKIVRFFKEQALPAEANSRRPPAPAADR